MCEILYDVGEQTGVVGVCCVALFCQAEDGIRDLVRSRGLGDVYKRQLTLLVSVVTLGIYTPRKVAIICEKAPAR